VAEEITLAKRSTRQTAKLSGTVRREQARVERRGHVRMHDDHD
jgi:stress response protein YsnF